MDDLQKAEMYTSLSFDLQNYIERMTTQAGSHKAGYIYLLDLIRSNPHIESDYVLRMEFKIICNLYLDKEFELLQFYIAKTIQTYTKNKGDKAG